jgi:hypothetical protein
VGLGRQHFRCVCACKLSYGQCGRLRRDRTALRRRAARLTSHTSPVASHKPHCPGLLEHSNNTYMIKEMAAAGAGQSARGQHRGERRRARRRAGGAALERPARARGRARVHLAGRHGGRGAAAGAGRPAARALLRACALPTVGSLACPECLARPLASSLAVHDPHAHVGSPVVPCQGMHMRLRSPVPERLCGSAWVCPIVCGSDSTLGPAVQDLVRAEFQRRLRSGAPPRAAGDSPRPSSHAASEP